MFQANRITCNTSPRRGTVAVLVAVCLIPILGIVAIALDGGFMMDLHRYAQATADAAALAAATDLYQNYPHNNGVDVINTANKSALTTASAMGYKNDGITSTVTVNIPPKSGKFLGQPGYAEVIAQINQVRSFSKIFGSGPLPVSARAVAVGRWVPSANGVIVLHPTAASAINANGNGDVKVKNSSIIVDSNNSQAATTVGNAYIADVGRSINITGSNPGYSGTFYGTVLTGQQPVPDPLAYLPVPDRDSLPVQQASGGQTVNLQPGRYQGGLSFSGQTTVNMAPGIYYMDDGPFVFAGQGSLNATGVMIYSTAYLSITGQGSVTLSPPTSGIYQGLSYFQSRSSTATTIVAGNGGYNVTGTFYLANGLSQLQGNGDASIASQVVTLLMTAGGNGVTNIVWNGPPTARTRNIGLVE